MNFSAPLPTKSAQEEGEVLAPRFDANGLLAAIAVDANDGVVLMLAHMNDEALKLTLQTGIAHYWSRSRNTLWKKGETSGNLQHVEEIRIDCDQDAILLKVTVAGHDATCHTGRRSCFFRRVDTGPDGPRLSTIDEPRFEPGTVYRR